MTKNKQIVVDSVKGDCMRACLTSMLDLPNDPKLVKLGGADTWWETCPKFLARFGLKLSYEQKACWRSGYWMASVKSRNFPTGTHAIVMKSHEVLFDPSTKKRYPAGKSLLGEDVVLGGHFLEVLDPTKFYKLELFRAEVWEKYNYGTNR